MADAISGGHRPPAHVIMRDGDEPFWQDVILSRARDEWLPADLVVAAQLARTQRDIETQQVWLDAEGTVTENARGTMVMNPRVTVMEGLARREMALMRTLRMGGRVAGDTRDQTAKRKGAADARKTQAEIEDDDLLA